MRAVSSAPSTTEHCICSRRSDAPSSSIRLFGGLFFGGARRFNRGDLFVERRDRVLGALQRGLLGGKGAGERRAPLHERCARLIHFRELGFALHPLCLELGHARLHGVALLGKFACAPVVDADLVGTRQQMLARFAEKLLARRGTRLQGIEPHALGGQFVLVPFVGFLDRVGEAGLVRCSIRRNCLPHDAGVRASPSDWPRSRQACGTREPLRR